MKAMRKLLTLVLAMTMILSMAVTVTATTPDDGVATAALQDKGTITIVGSASGTQYSVYRIFDIAKTADGKNVYVTNEKWGAFAEAENLKADGFFTISNDYLKTVTFTGETDDANAQMFAEYVMAYAEANNIAPDGQSAKLTTSGTYTTANSYQYGYYIMASDRVENDPNYTVFTLAANNVQVYEKNTMNASIQKFVQEDSNVSNADGGWGATNAAEIAQAVHFKIVVTAAAGTDTYVVTDSMPNFTDISAPTYTYSRGEIPENGLTYAATADGFTVTFGPSFRALLEDGDTVTIEYTAELKANATIAGAGNLNSATLTHGEETSEPAITTTYTFKLNVTKVDENNRPLAGAVFTLSHKDNTLKFDREADTNNYIVNPNGDVTQITTDNTGKFSISGLDTEDEYILEEIQAPDPYVLMDPVSIIISPAEGSTDHTHNITVQNLPGVEMPETGGMGTTVFYVAGGILVLAAIALLVTKKRTVA
ncbi:MAG: SpaA isopeptide-forming pilin-related protein [Oscillospiraceae bacterium]|nr:SpaA isopeptide-forming pilin-related protein [Oscillospiraceae bacterium]